MSGSLTLLIAAISAIRTGVGIVQHQAIHHGAYSPYLTVLLIESVKISCASLLLTRALYKERQSAKVDQADYTKLAEEDYDINASTDDLSSERSSLQPDAELSQPRSTQRTLYHLVLSQIFARQGLRLIVPALLYVAQNNLCLVGATELDPAFFQALWQMRLLVSAVLSRFVLKRHINRLQWLCIVGIFCGVLFVKSATKGHEHGDGIKVGHRQLSSSVLATIQVAAAAVLSSVAGIALEYIFRDRTINLWASNVQLSAFSILPAALLVLVSDKHQLSPVLHHLTHSFWPISVVIFHSMNGMLVALMLKKAGVIINDLASALAIILTFLLNTALFPSDSEVRGFGKITFVCLGSASILTSTVMYQRCAATIKDDAQTKAHVASRPLPISTFAIQDLPASSTSAFEADSFDMQARKVYINTTRKPLCPRHHSFDPDARAMHPTQSPLWISNTEPK